MSKNSNVFQIKYREKFALMYRTRVRTLCLNWIVSFIYGLVRSGIFLRSLLTNVNWIKEFLAGKPLLKTGHLLIFQIFQNLIQENLF